MKIFFILNFLYFILSSFAWPTAYIPDIAITIFGIAVYFGYYLIYKIKFNFDFNSKFIIGIYMAFMAYNVTIGAYTISLKYIPAVLLCFLDHRVKLNLLQFVTKWYSIAIIISLILFGISFAVQLPSLGIVNHYIYDPYINYVFYLKPTNILQELRFNSFFFEPGHCALVGVFLLFANKFKLKSNYYLIPIFLSVLFSLSLAGYVLIFIGLLFLNITKFKIILSITGIIAIGYIFVSYIWNDGENPVNELIVARLEYDESGGVKGNNRAYLDTDRVLEKTIDANKIWTGLGMNRFNELFNHSIAGSGYKIFLLQYGIIGMLLVGFMFYSYSLTATKGNRHFAILFLLFIGLAFLQRYNTPRFSDRHNYGGMTNNRYICKKEENQNGKTIEIYSFFQGESRRGSAQGNGATGVAGQEIWRGTLENYRMEERVA